jgi:hypothetical protein
MVNSAAELTPNESQEHYAFGEDDEKGRRKSMSSHRGRCPKCAEPLSVAHMEGIKVAEVTGITWKGVSFHCPHCDTVLGVGVDLLAAYEKLSTSVDGAFAALTRQLSELQDAVARLEKKTKAFRHSAQ